MYAYLKSSNMKNRSRISIDEYVKNDHKGKIEDYFGNELIARKGHINRHHFAHKKGQEYYDFHLPDEWFINWMLRFDASVVEQPITIKGHTKIADVLSRDGTAIMFVNAFITPEQIRDIESFFGKVIWIVNANYLKDKCLRDAGLIGQCSDEYIKYAYDNCPDPVTCRGKKYHFGTVSRLLHNPLGTKIASIRLSQNKNIAHFTKPSYLNIGNKMFRVKKLNTWNGNDMSTDRLYATIHGYNAISKYVARFEKINYRNKNDIKNKI